MTALPDPQRRYCQRKQRTEANANGHDRDAYHYRQRVNAQHQQHGAVCARHGEYLQIRPKAANAKALTEAIGARGERILTLPRGFYLKKNFTSALLARHFLIQ